MGKKITLIEFFQIKAYNYIIIFILLYHNVVNAQSVSAIDAGPLTFSPGIGEKILFDYGELQGTLNSISINATYTNGSTNVYANDLAVFVLDGQSTILQFGGYTHLVVGGERKEWSTGATATSPTTFSDTQILDNPITFNLNDNHRIAIALGNYSPGAVGTWESITIMLNGLSKAAANLDYIEKNKIAVFPNPSIGILNVTNTYPDFIDSLQIINSEGRIIKKIHVVGHFTQINISDLTSGVYNLVATSSGNHIIKKFIKH